MSTKRQYPAGYPMTSVAMATVIAMVMALAMTGCEGSPLRHAIDGTPLDYTEEQLEEFAREGTPDATADADTLSAQTLIAPF